MDSVESLFKSLDDSGALFTSGAEEIDNFLGTVEQAQSTFIPPGTIQMYRQLAHPTMFKETPTNAYIAMLIQEHMYSLYVRNDFGDDVKKKHHGLQTVLVKDKIVPNKLFFDMDGGHPDTSTTVMMALVGHVEAVPKATDSGHTASLC